MVLPDFSTGNSKTFFKILQYSIKNNRQKCGPLWHDDTTMEDKYKRYENDLFCLSTMKKNTFIHTVVWVPVKFSLHVRTISRSKMLI